MSHQFTFSGSEFNRKKRNIRKVLFLTRMNELMFLDQLEVLIDLFYP